MKVTVEFDSIEEFEAFRTSGKRTRSKKEEADDAGQTVPQPLAPPTSATTGFNPQSGNMGFTAPPAGGATQAGGAFPAAGAPVVAPEVQALVTRINTRIDGAIASGQPADQVLAWFRSQCGAEAANATMDQIKQNFLPKAAVPVLENIAKLMNA